MALSPHLRLLRLAIRTRAAVLPEEVDVVSRVLRRLTAIGVGVEQRRHVFRPARGARGGGAVRFDTGSESDKCTPIRIELRAGHGGAVSGYGDAERCGPDFVEGVRKQVDELTKADLSSVKEIRPEDKGQAAQDLYAMAQDLIDFAEGPVQKLKTSKPGVVTGLAYTPTGGEVLHIEATRYPGKGNITLTGQIGNVMKESVQADRLRGLRKPSPPDAPPSLVCCRSSDPDANEC